MASRTETSRKPRPGPIWTGYGPPSESMPKTAFKGAPSPRALHSLPPRVSSMPMPPRVLHPYSHRSSMRKQEQAMVDSLGQRTRHPSLSSPVRLIPIEERSPKVPRLGPVTLLSPLNLDHGLPSPPLDTPHGLPSPRLSSPRERKEHNQRAREAVSLEHGLPSPRLPSPKERREYKQRVREVATRTACPRPHVVQRDGTPRDDKQPHPANHATAPTFPAVYQREQLRTWGHVYLGSAKTADAFVVARSLRRPSQQSSTSTEAGDDDDDAPNKQERTTPETPSAAPGAFPPHGRTTTFRAVVRPRDPERQSFLIQRRFDMDALRATIPDPHVAAPPAAMLPAAGGARRHASPPDPHSSVCPGAIFSGGSERADNLLAAPCGRATRRCADDTCAQGANLQEPPPPGAGRAVPIHLKYAQAHLPVLAAILGSGHVRAGDTVFLPLPCAEAWPQTVRYVYTGEEGGLEVSGQVRANILYLAGKV